MRGITRIGFLTLMTAIVPVVADAVTRRVPSEYATMNAALGVSSAGDTVLVAPGVYTDYQVRQTVFGITSLMAFIPDGVVLRSESGANVTELRHGAASTTGALAFWAEGHTSGQTVIEGFRVTTGSLQRGGLEHVLGGEVTLRSCRFEGLDVGVFLWAADVVLEDCEFDRIGESLAGGAIGSQEGQVRMTRCKVLNCPVGAVQLTGYPGGHADYAEIRDCHFEGNVNPSNEGGALKIYSYGQGVVLDGCTFINNSTQMPTGQGLGGAAAISGLGTNVVTNCVFRGNEGQGLGGALFMSSGTVSGCSFYDNTILSPAFGGGAAVFFSPGGGTLSSNVFATTIGDNAVGTDVRGPIVSSCNVFWDNQAGIGITLSPTDRVADPLFCDPLNGDLTLREDSPCLPANSNGCGQIGALGEGCGVISVESKSWGEIKAAYRGTEARP
jgi:hypothetical protein